jgi:hypothetical protein
VGILVYTISRNGGWLATLNPKRARHVSIWCAYDALAISIIVATYHKKIMYIIIHTSAIHITYLYNNFSF